jgi:hypothetical protein
VGSLSGLALLGAAGAVLAATTPEPKTVAVRDPAGDARGDNAPDIKRVSMGRGSDGRLLATMSLAAKLSPADLLADEGPPGSLCMRLWTVSKPPSAPADYLVCATAQEDETLRASVLKEDKDGLPDRVGAATVSLRAGHIVILRFSQSAIQRPETIRFAGEATRAGCPRVSCVDVAPDAPATGMFRLRQVP